MPMWTDSGKKPQAGGVRRLQYAHIRWTHGAVARNSNSASCYDIMCQAEARAIVERRGVPYLLPDRTLSYGFCNGTG